MSHQHAVVLHRGILSPGDACDSGTDIFNIMSPEELRRKVRTLRLLDNIKPGKCWVAMLKHDARFLGAGISLQRNDFVWRVYDRSLTVGHCEEEYNRTVSTRAVLTVGGRNQALSTTDRLADLDTLVDNLVVLQAHEETSCQEPITRGSLELINRAVTSQQMQITARGEMRDNERARMSLDNEVQICRRFIETLDGIVQTSQAISENVLPYLDGLRKLNDTNFDDEYVISLAGQTGAGKSSLIAALLDLKDVIPTGCSGTACTAAAIAISYNYDEVYQYVAKVELLTKEEVRLELENLIAELGDPASAVGSSDAARQAAKVAAEKVKVLWPAFQSKGFSKMDIDALVRELDADVRLGSQVELRSNDRKDFAQQLRRYVSSSSNATSVSGKRSVGGRQLWPVVKYGRLYVRAELLKHGLVFVDLPGVQDSNAARAAVVEDFLKHSTAVWIVGLIIRAVDDKIVQGLLGEHFKQRMQLDGHYGKLTTVCTKTDDIDPEEMLAAGDPPEGLEILRNKKETCDQEIFELECRCEQLRKLCQTLEDEVQSLKERQDVRVKRGRTMQVELTTCVPSGRKRKRSSGQHESQRCTMDSRTPAIGRTDAEGGMTIEQNMSAFPSLGPCKDGTPELESIRCAIRIATDRLVKCNHDIAETDARLGQLQKERSVIEKLMRTLCIKWRNEKVKRELIEQFAAERARLDADCPTGSCPHTVGQGKEFTFDSNDKPTDCAELKVFCVSSRDYQQHAERSKHRQLDLDDPGVQLTGIPQLKQHCETIARSHWSSSRKAYLRKFTAIIRSIRTWTQQIDQEACIQAEESQRMASLLADQLGELEADLLDGTEEFKTEIATDLDRSIVSKLRGAGEAAEMTALKTMEEFSSMHHMTYRGFMIRDGIFRRPVRPKKFPGRDEYRDVDMNADLASPALIAIASGWVQTFGTRVPAGFETWTNRNNDRLLDVHEQLRIGHERIIQSSGAASTTGDQNEFYSERLREVAILMEKTVQDRARDLHRSFGRTVVDTLQSAYATAAREHGKGSARRMHQIMESRVEEQQHKMFQQAVDMIEEGLVNIIADMREGMVKTVADVVEYMRHDYKIAFGVNAGQPSAKAVHRLHKLKSDIKRAIDDLENNLEQSKKL